MPPSDQPGAGTVRDLGEPDGVAIGHDAHDHVCLIFSHEGHQIVHRLPFGLAATLADEIIERLLLIAQNARREAEGVKPEDMS